MFLPSIAPAWETPIAGLPFYMFAQPQQSPCVSEDATYRCASNADVCDHVLSPSETGPGAHCGDFGLGSSPGHVTCKDHYKA